jgi:hypothetical protein
VCIADSAGENKNNTVLAYFTDLVDNGWFDVVELLFGPVGHTHNGVDATHKIHNQNVGNCTSGDLGHFVQNYPKGFSGKETVVPEASILNKTLNWKDYYKPHMRPLAGFAKSKNDPVAVRGFRIEREKTGTVSTRWKADPALEKEWRGEDGHSGTTGLHVLKSAPEGLPDFVIPTNEHELSTQSLNKLRSKNMFEALDPQGLSACMGYNYDCAKDGLVSIHSYVDELDARRQWGRPAMIGAVPAHRGRVRVIDEFWDKSLEAAGRKRSVLWKLPLGQNGEEKDATSNKHHFSNDQALLDNRRLPAVRYQDTSKANSAISRHPQVPVQDKNVDDGFPMLSKVNNQVQGVPDVSS